MKPQARSFPRRIYRFMDEEIHARRLLEGYVWISSFGWLRETERARGDPDEAKLFYKPGSIDTDIPGPHTEQQLKNLASMGFVCKPGATIKLNLADPQAFEVNHIPTDGFLFCGTTSSPTKSLRTAFGHHCVRIADPERFVWLVSKEMTRLANAWYAGKLDYSGRNYAGSADIPAPGVFLGPPGNADEAEYRIYWPPRAGVVVEPFELPVPAVANLCSIV